MPEQIAPKETKSEKFERLAEQRVNVIIKELQKLGNLSNTRNYHYTEQHVKQMFTTINRSLRGTKKLFTENSNSKQQNFKFKRMRP